MQLKVKKISERAVLPSKKNDEDACFDLSILIDNDNPPMKVDCGEFTSLADICKFTDHIGRNCVSISPNESVVFHTGLKFETERGYNMKVHVRSSTGIKKNLILSNATGVVDTATYRGEVLVGLTNIGDKEVEVCDLERVAQFEIVKTLDVELVETEALSETERGEGGFGSTGGH